MSCSLVDVFQRKMLSPSSGQNEPRVKHFVIRIREGRFHFLYSYLPPLCPNTWFAPWKNNFVSRTALVPTLRPLFFITYRLLYTSLTSILKMEAAGSSESRYSCTILQGDQKVSVHLMITIQKVTSNVQSVPRQSPDVYWHADRQGQGDTRITLTPSVIPNSNYVIMVSDWNCLKYFCVFFVL
jgi:hypothetical protein